MPNLHVVVGGTRPARLGPPVAQWAAKAAEKHGGFDVELVDLAERGLPLLDEPAHPRTGQYTHEHTRTWSATVDEADAFVFVTPEYNYGPPAALRSVQVLKQLLTTLKVMPREAAATDMLDELLRWTDPLQILRKSVAEAPSWVRAP
ncbi:NADPH-dependent FMN reductase [Streptomyces sp. NPDC001663]|uniref:NADPH-dependent FMN reductase n=1 Tax=Streptomyces sp. NPDC001663 TaxID=3364597 RepID=UPI0036A899ED